ncbi:MAG: gamma-glutamyl-gamma-aminobutyrate hydrolase family protein [Chloroflexota bacterium]|nr:gamma-glutamyl-gamma-aminobutyrate hydrolase family protein [Chloroflexota bacterium]
MGPRVVATLCGHDRPTCVRARAEYLAALRGAGLDVIALDPHDAVPEDFDALCLTGGGDIEPSRYGEPAAAETDDVDPARDALELRLLRDALDRDIPVLGICRGFQLINVAKGGSLVQHVDGHSRSQGAVRSHEAVPAAGSLLAGATSDRAHVVNSSHHQAVTDAVLAPGLVPTVRIDGLVEAFEDPAHRWFVAVQWHPERTAEVSAEATRIFRSFADAASREPARAR